MTAAILLGYWRACLRAAEQAEAARQLLCRLGRPKSYGVVEDNGLFFLAVLAATLAACALTWAWAGAGRGGALAWSNPRRRRQGGG
jgi:hypothetical protein